MSVLGRESEAAGGHTGGSTWPIPRLRDFNLGITPSIIMDRLGCACVSGLDACGARAAMRISGFTKQKRHNDILSSAHQGPSGDGVFLRSLRAAGGAELLGYVCGRTGADEAPAHHIRRRDISRRHRTRRTRFGFRSRSEVQSHAR